MASLHFHILVLAGAFCGSVCSTDGNKEKLDLVSYIVCDKGNAPAKERVMFSANLENNLSTQNNSRIVFNQVLVNEGNSYSGTTGVFTCKVPGLYQFSWLIHQTSGPAGLHIRLMHNNTIKFTNYISQSNDNLSGTTMLYLKAGDTVWIETLQAGRLLVGLAHSTFSGELNVPGAMCINGSTESTNIKLVKDIECLLAVEFR